MQGPAATPSWWAAASGACSRLACSPTISTGSPSSSGTSCRTARENRPGVPQARHLHFLFKRGLMVVEELFPGVTADLLEAGSHLLDQGRDFRILYRSGWSPRGEIGLEFCTFTRPLLEATIRRHLMADARISLRQGFEVAGLVTRADGSRVEGVRIEPRHRDPDAPPEVETIAAELVLDTSGRGSKAPEWLAAAGFARPRGDGRRRLLGVCDPHLRAGRGLQEGLEDALPDQPAAVPAARRHHPADRGEPLDRDARRGDARLSAHGRGGLPQVRAQPLLAGALPGDRARQAAVAHLGLPPHREPAAALRQGQGAAGLRGARRLGVRLQPGLRRRHDARRPRGPGAAREPARAGRGGSTATASRSRSPSWSPVPGR